MPMQQHPIGSAVELAHRCTLACTLQAVMRLNCKASVVLKAHTQHLSTLSVTIVTVHTDASNYATCTGHTRM